MAGFSAHADIFKTSFTGDLDSSSKQLTHAAFVKFVCLYKSTFKR